MVNNQRLFLFKKIDHNLKGPVVYWMSRDQRFLDNWALLYAIEKANSLNTPLFVVFALTNSFQGANERHYSFMLKGLSELMESLCGAGIGFYVLNGEPHETIPAFLGQVNASLLVSDFDPLKVKRSWKAIINERISISHVEVDAHNIVPCRLVSQKVEFGAYTLRPKINRLLNDFLTEFPLPELRNKVQCEPVNWVQLEKWLSVDTSVKPIDWLEPGEKAGSEILNEFILSRLNGYSEKRNNPLLNGQSNLSPYLHFGQISAQRVAVEVAKANAPTEDKSAFLEELIVRRELSDNFCFYNPDYDSVMGFHAWATTSLLQHEKDEREFLYTLNEFENGLTHDALWNAAQSEMVHTGKMHGYLRMYWAKKILEWTTSPQQAMDFAIFLNDKYSIDGRDPNGYTGIAWSIGGIHDRAWSERPVYGKIRYMNYNGCKRKFDVSGYITKNLNI
jgi:deoxyribodipyrimidine photo-lyase